MDVGWDSGPKDAIGYVVAYLNASREFECNTVPAWSGWGPALLRSKRTIPQKCREGEVAIGLSKCEFSERTRGEQRERERG